MDATRWERAQAVFHAALERPLPDRLAFIKAECGHDQDLIKQVQALLEEGARGSSPLDGGLVQMTGALFGADTSALPFPEIGPYRLRKLLGEGGMGVVYLGEREDLGSTAAIKLLRDGSLSPARRERFANEQRTLAHLTHPAIARLYDADTLADGTPWFAMEYVDGLPLTDYCQKRECSIPERVKLFRSVCDAVRYAHALGIIHRDSKPSNILVQPDGIVKLLDFGIAKHVDAGQAGSNETRTGLRMMTPAYAAPEQVRGEPTGTYTDVYALGTILYQLLTGRLPFDVANRSPGELEANVLDKEPEKPSSLAKNERSRKASWADLDVLCLTAMQKDPERRYRSADAFLRDIDHYLAAEPLDARADSFLYRAKKFMARHRRPMIAACLGFAAMAALAIFYTVRLAAARNAALAEAARTQRVLHFTLDLFDGGDKEVGPASDLRVTDLINRGIGEEARLTRDPDVQADLDETLGEVCQKLGDFGQADRLLSAALARRRSVFGPNDPKVAASLVALGLLRDDVAKLPEAEKLVREALAIGRRNLPEDKPTLAAATHALGKVLEDRGSYSEAIQLLTEATRMRSEPWAARTDLAASLLELANAQFYAGHYGEAQKLNERLLVIHGQLYGPRHPLLAEDLINLGAIQQDLAHYPEAEAFHRRALVITESYYGKDHYKTASNLTLIARALAKEGRYDEAAGLLKRALAIQERVFGEDNPKVASALNELGSVAMARGRYPEAAADFRSMADIYRSVYGGKHYLIGIALANLGGVFMAQKDNAHAESLFREAIAIFSSTLTPNSLNEGIARIKLGRALRRQKPPLRCGARDFGRLRNRLKTGISGGFVAARCA